MVLPYSSLPSGLSQLPPETGPWSSYRRDLPCQVPSLWDSLSQEDSSRHTTPLVGNSLSTNSPKDPTDLLSLLEQVTAVQPHTHCPVAQLPQCQGYCQEIRKTTPACKTRGSGAQLLYQGHPDRMLTAYLRTL